MLVIGCGCCFFFLFTDARQRMFARQNLEQQEREAAVVAAATVTDLANKHFIDNKLMHATESKSISGFERANNYSENNISYNAAKNAMIYHKRSTVV